MPIDAYSLCPGGIDRKVKFCCADLLAELQKIDRMVEGEQYLACLQHIDRLQEQGRPRACLLATKALLLRTTGQAEAAEANLQVFREHFPDNPVALAEAAILQAVNEGGRAGLATLQQLFATPHEHLPSRVYEALGVVAEALMEDEEWIAARAVLQLQMSLAPNDEHALELLMQINHSPRLALLLKNEPAWTTPPAGASWVGRFEEAVAPLRAAHWQGAADRLAALAADVPDAPEVWQHLATLRSWLADAAGASAALKKLAALPIPLEDAVEAATTAMLLADDPLGDNVDLLHVIWTVADQDRLQEALLSDGRIVPIPFDAGRFAKDNEPPPRMIAALLDRPQVATAEGLSLQAIPRLSCQLLLFGRQTDRPARLEAIGLTASDLTAIDTVLRQIGGEAVSGEATTQVVGHISASRRGLMRAWHPPQDASREQVEALALEHERTALLDTWPEVPLAVLAGKSPREAAADPAQRVTLLAAISLLEEWRDGNGVGVDSNELRTRLGLPLLGPIEAVEAKDVEKLSLNRLSRVALETLSDEGLLVGFRRALLFSVHEALRRFAQAIIQRQSLAEHPDRLRAYRVLAQTAENLDEAIQQVELGRKAGQLAGQSCASWDLMELSFRLARREAAEAQRLMQHIQAQHLREPGIAETLTQMLIDIGVLHPDGTPVAHPGGVPPTAVAAPGEPPAGRSAIWTPGSESAGGGGGGKLWTPE